MLNSFDYFDCRPEMGLVLLDLVDDRLERLSSDFHPRMDCILLKCLIWEQHGRQLVEQLDPILNDIIIDNTKK